MTPESISTAADKTGTEVLDRARAMVPVLKERAIEAERLRRLPDETVHAFRDAGFFRILQPVRYGGFELDYGTQTELAVELAQGCASSAWNACITACHGWMTGMFPDQAQDEVWGADRNATISTSFFAVEPRVESADGGLRLSGRWKFSSGVDHCQWSILAFRRLPPGRDSGPPEEYFALVPLADCEVEDTWHVAGLSGTGSNDIVVSDLFVPDHRVLRVMALRGQPSPGSAVNPGYLYSLPLHAVFSFNIVGMAIGTARGAVDSVIAALADRTSITQARLADQQSAQLRVAEAGAEVDAAYALMDRNRAEIVRDGWAGRSPDLDQRVRYRRDNSFAAILCVRAVDRVFPLLGGQGLADNHPVQRAWRDIHAISHHIALTWDLQGGLQGAVALGRPCPDPRI